MSRDPTLLLLLHPHESPHTTSRSTAALRVVPRSFAAAPLVCCHSIAPTGRSCCRHAFLFTVTTRQGKRTTGCCRCSEDFCPIITATRS
ncbi:hypothetical protein PAHAL_2G324500 [Panicum hallii]|uniref:Uncharacterized protein n=1 Tax=Panicum hallii TaxID=206008 RepID=A0A2T8KR31_9POAL|nr:hypothetical protein PAHAL_2G324500 [Panicum hallii]